MSLLSMNELTTFQWSFEEDLHHYCKAGYQGIGVWLRKLYDYGEERAAEILKESGLTVSNVVWAGGFTGSDGCRAGDNIVAGKRALQASAQIGAKCLVVYTGGRNSHTIRHADRLLRSALDELLPYAEEFGVPLAIEPMHPACAAEWSFLTSLESTAELVESYQTPSLKMVYDSYHFPLYGEQIALLDSIAPLLGVVHLGDYDKPHTLDQDRCRLGQGEAPLLDLVQALENAGYQGFYDVELMGPEIETANYIQLLQDTHETFKALTSPSLSEIR